MLESGLEGEHADRAITKREATRFTGSPDPGGVVTPTPVGLQPGKCQVLPPQGLPAFADQMLGLLCGLYSKPVLLSDDR